MHGVLSNFDIKQPSKQSEFHTMMLVVLERILMTAITIKLDPVVSLTTEQFYQICQENPELKLERTAHQEIVAMPPTGGETGRSNANINFQLSLWNNQTELGEVFDSSTGFSLPNGAGRTKTVEIYRPHMTVEIMTNPTMVGGEKVLPGFILNLAKVWS
jgi:Uma2 family endonuclease